MYQTEIKNDELFIDGVPFSEWTSKEWTKWKSNTSQLLVQCDRISSKLQFIAQHWETFKNSVK